MSNTFFQGGDFCRGSLPPCAPPDYGPVYDKLVCWVLIYFRFLQYGTGKVGMFDPQPLSELP